MCSYAVTLNTSFWGKHNTSAMSMIQTNYGNIEPTAAGNNKCIMKVIHKMETRTTPVIGQ